MGPIVTCYMSLYAILGGFIGYSSYMNSIEQATQVKISTDIVSVCGESLDVICDQARKTIRYGSTIPAEDLLRAKYCDLRLAEAALPSVEFARHCLDVAERLKKREIANVGQHPAG